MNVSDRERAVAEAHARGIAAARSYDERLRRVEALERNELLEQGGEQLRTVDQAEVASLRLQVEHFRSFYLAVMRSRGWWALQALRRLVGRAW